MNAQQKQTTQEDSNRDYQKLVRKEINEYIKTKAGVITKWKSN